MAAPKRGRPAKHISLDFDPTDYHYDELAKKAVLAHPAVQKRIATTKKRLQDAAQVSDDDMQGMAMSNGGNGDVPAQGRQKAAVQVPRNVKAPMQLKDTAQVTDVTPQKAIAQVATTKMAKQSTSTRKRGSRARY